MPELLLIVLCCIAVLHRCVPEVLANLLDSAIDLEKSISNSNMSSINMTDNGGHVFDPADIIEGLE